MSRSNITGASLCSLQGDVNRNNPILNFRRQANYQIIPTNVGLGKSEAIQSYNQMVLERNRLLENATVNNPLVKDVSAQIDGMKSSIMQTLAKNLTALDISKENL